MYRTNNTYRNICRRRSFVKKMYEAEGTVITIKDSIANIEEKINNEVEQLMKIQLSDSKQFSEQTVPMVKTEKEMVIQLVTRYC